jgi:hypothetical protein
VNDKDGFICNFWRAVHAAPEAVAKWADWPVNENDQHARHLWLKDNRVPLTAKLEGDPQYYDAMIAGWWVWGLCCWIGAGWCDADGGGPWVRDDAGQLVHLGDAGRGIHRQRVHLGAGRGIHRKLVHLGNAGQGIHRQRVHLGAGRGIHRQLVHLGDAGQGSEVLLEWMLALADRLRRVRVCCGDWTRVCGPTPTVTLGLTGVFLDPPYLALDSREANLYGTDDGTVATAVREWALEWGDDHRMRIVLCGYEGEHEMPNAWREVRWKAHGGYGLQGEGRGRDNAGRERLWLSPHCLSERRLLDGLDDAQPGVSA